MKARKLQFVRSIFQTYRRVVMNKRWVLSIGLTIALMNTTPLLAGLPDVIVDHTTTLPVVIDLWAYATDAETPDSGLTYTIEGLPPAGAGVSIVGNRWLNVNPSSDWCGYTDVTVRATDPGGLWDEDTFRVAVTWSCR
jgi:hypothetical protein